MKKIIAVVLLFIVAWSGMGTVAMAEEQTADPADTAIIYNKEADAEAIVSLVESFGKSADVLDVNWLYDGALSGYKYIVLLTSGYLDEAIKTDKPLLCIGSDFEGESAKKINVGLVNIQVGDLQQNVSVGGLIDVPDGTGDETYGSVTDSFGTKYPFAVRNGNIWTVPYFNTADISTAGLGGVMAQFFSYNETPKLYVMIDQVFAFSDLQLLKETAEALHQNGFPFIVRVMPVYQNTEYPAFKRWAQLLRYVQSLDGDVVLHDAIVQEDMAEKISVEEIMQIAADALANERVNLYDFSSAPYSIDFSMIENTESSTRQFAGFPMNAAFVYSLPEDEEGIEKMVDELNRKWLTVSDYKRNFTDESAIYNEKPYDEEYAYVKPVTKNYQAFFTAGNNLLIVVVGISIILLAILFLVGRYFYRRKFLMKGGDK